MDAKDLRTESALSDRDNGGSKYAQSGGVVLQCDRNKSYQDIGSNSLAKVDGSSARPCAVIGPDRVVPPSIASDAYLKKVPPESWPCTDNTYRPPPDYPHKINYQNPTRNISPRQTFQENMQRIMVPPTYNSTKLCDDTNYSQTSNGKIAVNIIPRNIKYNVPLEVEYGEVPYAVNPNSNEHKNVRNPEMCVPSVNPAHSQSSPYGWPPSSINLRSGRAYGAPDLYQYQDYPSCVGPRPAVPRSHQPIPEDPGYRYSDHYYQDGNIRFKPYPNMKDRYPPTRYEYITNYSNPFHPPPFPHKYDLQKSMPPHFPPYAPVKYLDNRVVEPVLEGYQRNQQGTYNMTYRNQVIHPNYGTVISSCAQNKMHPYPPEGSVKTVAPNKIPYDNNNKTYIDYDSSRPKTYAPPDGYFVNEMGRLHPMKNQVIMPNFSNLNIPAMPSNAYYKKDNTPIKNYEYFRNIDANINIQNPMSRHPSLFSPNTFSISPTDSSNSNDPTQILGNSLEEYLNQSSTANIRSIDSNIGRAQNHYYRRYYDNRHGPLVRTSPMMNKPELNSNNNISKDKKHINLRQFIQMWNEGDDETEDNNSKDIVIKTGSSENNSYPKTHDVVADQEQLYVLGLVNVPNEELSKYEHLQTVSKLPENIKGYNNIELLKQFEEAIESSNTNNFKSPTPKENFQMKTKGILLKQTPELLPRPVSPLDVEAKISQSVIHKEVGCNFEIRPCSPKMMNVEIAAPVQNILSERVIEKVTNPNLNLKSPILNDLDENVDFNLIKRQDHTMNNENSRNASCKMINTQFTNDNPVDSIKNAYSLQDLESNSGLCLASLPRLDNDIELNFPEVNQQFINANKESTVLKMSAKDLPALDIPDQSNSKNADIMDVVRMETKTYRSPLPCEPERETCKLSKYRKNKIYTPEAAKEDHSQPNSKTIRTDSVIIKNPDNTKNCDDIPEFYKNFLSEVNTIQQSPINLTSPGNVPENKIDIISNSTCMDNDYSKAADIAIDFSLNKNEKYSRDTKIDKEIRNFEQEVTEREVTEQRLQNIEERPIGIDSKNSECSDLTKNQNSICSEFNLNNDMIKNVSEETFKTHRKIKNVEYVKPTPETNVSCPDIIDKVIKTPVTSTTEVIEITGNNSIRLDKPEALNETQIITDTKIEKLVDIKQVTINFDTDSEEIGISHNNSANSFADSPKNDESNSVSTYDPEYEKKSIMELSARKETYSYCTNTNGTRDEVLDQENIEPDLKKAEKTSMDSTKRYIHVWNKELFSPWIQKLITYSAGKVFSQKNIASAVKNIPENTSYDHLEEAYQNRLKTGEDYKKQTNNEQIMGAEDLSSGDDSNSSDSEMSECTSQEYDNDHDKNIEHEQQNNKNSINKKEIVTNDLIFDHSEIGSQNVAIEMESSIIHNEKNVPLNNINDQIESSLQENVSSIDSSKKSVPPHDLTQENNNKGNFLNETGSPLHNFEEIDSPSVVIKELELPLQDNTCRTLPSFEEIEESHKETPSAFESNKKISYTLEVTKQLVFSCKGNRKMGPLLKEPCVMFNRNEKIDAPFDITKTENELPHEVSKEMESPLEDDTNKRFPHQEIEYAFHNKITSSPEITNKDVSINDTKEIDPRYEDTKETEFCEDAEIGSSLKKTSSTFNSCKKNSSLVNTNKIKSFDVNKEISCPHEVTTEIECLCESDTEIGAPLKKIGSMTNIHKEIDSPNITNKLGFSFDDTKETGSPHEVSKIIEPSCENDTGVESSTEEMISTINGDKKTDTALDTNEFVSSFDDNTEIGPPFDNTSIRCSFNDNNKISSQHEVTKEIKSQSERNTKIMSESCRQYKIESSLDTCTEVDPLDFPPKKEDSLEASKPIENRIGNHEISELEIDKEVRCLESVAEIDNNPPGGTENGKYIVQCVSDESSFTPDENVGEETNTTIDNPNTCIEFDENRTILKPRHSLKRSLSDSALNSYNDEEFKDNGTWPLKRRRINHIGSMEPDLLTQDLCNIIHSNRRNSISSIYNEENLSFCILIDNTCIIAEEDSNEQKVCYTQFSENCVAEVQNESINENEKVDIVAAATSNLQADICEYSHSFTLNYAENKTLEDSWVEDIACVETVISDDIAENIEISGPSSIKDNDLSDNDEHSVFNNAEHTDKVKYIYGEKMCSDDAQYVDILYKTPQMDVNKALFNRGEAQVPKEPDKYSDRDSLEKILSESNGNEPYAAGSVEPAIPSNIRNTFETRDDKENMNIEHFSILLNTVSAQVLDAELKEIPGSLQPQKMYDKTQDDTVHSCESSTDNVFSYKDEQKGENVGYITSSSPEVSSTTSEDKNSGILLKITNYKGSRISQINSLQSDNERPSCKFTEKNDYLHSHSKFPKNRPLLTKAAQKYIPPLKETIPDLKVKLSLPQHSLMKLKQLKKSKYEPKLVKPSSSVPILPKKPKPKFEDVLRSIDEIQFNMHKGKTKKAKKIIPKVVIKKNRNGSHYASTSGKDEYNPDLTGRKWQPWVFLEKNSFIDKMAIRKKTKAIFSHRKNMYVLAEKFKKYKSVNNAKFVISQPKTENSSTGLKYTIRLKHHY